jgi:nucleoside 2-deoxyribosyltransferase
VRIYFADNSRLRSDAHGYRAETEGLCLNYRMVAEWPFEHFLFPTGLTITQRLEAGLPIDDPAAVRVVHKSWRLICNCQAIVAEVSAFRGAHMNPLVAFEIGVAVVHKIPVFAWTKDVTADGEFIDLFERLMCVNDDVSPDGNWRDDDGDLVENFGMVEFAAIVGNFVSLSASLADAIARCAEHFDGAGGRM